MVEEARSRAFSLSWLQPLPDKQHCVFAGMHDGPPGSDGSSRGIEKTRERVSEHWGAVVDPDVNVEASIQAEKGRERPSRCRP